MAESEAGTRIFLQPARMMLSAINDLVELQRAEVTFADIPRGQLHFRVEMYGFTWEYRFSVEDLRGGRSRVTLRIVGEATDKADRISRQLVLLDSMLPGRMGKPAADEQLQ